MKSEMKKTKRKVWFYILIRDRCLITKQREVDDYQNTKSCDV